MIIKNKFYQIFEIVSKVNGLREVNDNVYVNDNGDYFYLDKYGFHTQNQLSNIGLLYEKIKYNKLIQKYNKLIAHEEKMDEQDELSQRSRSKIRKILNNEELPDIEKIRLLKRNMKIKK